MPARETDEQFTSEERRAAIDYWTAREPEAKRMPAGDLAAYIREFLGSHNTCALATGADGYVRCTPVEYGFHDDAIWIFTEGGQKFRGLLANPQVSLAVFDPYAGFGTTNGVQIQGLARLVTPFCDEYVAHAKAQGVPLDALRKLASPMHLVKVTPTRIDVLSSGFKKNGYSARQWLCWQ